MGDYVRGRGPEAWPTPPPEGVRVGYALLVSQLLAHLAYLDEAIHKVSAQLDTAMAPFQEALARLDTIHGVNKRTAEVLIAELGPDITVFPTAKHAVSVRFAKGAFVARYRRIMPHRGHKKAVAAVAHAILATAYHVLARQTTYQDPGSEYDDRRHQPERVRRRAIQTLECQGLRVALEPAA